MVDGTKRVFDISEPTGRVRNLLVSSLSHFSLSPSIPLRKRRTHRNHGGQEILKLAAYTTFRAPLFFPLPRS